MKINELLPCPFCGGNSLINSTNLVQCRACDASGPDLGHAAGEEDRAEAARMWNRRAPISGEPVTNEKRKGERRIDYSKAGMLNRDCKDRRRYIAPFSGERGDKS